MNLSFWRNKRVFIAGGLGFIGSSLAEYLLPYVHSMIILDGQVEGSGANIHNIESIRSEPRLQYINDRLENVAHWGSVLDECDVIFNFASVNAHNESMADPLRDMHRNLLPHLLFSKYCSSLKRVSRLIFASSRSVYGRIDTSPIPENTAKYPLDYYSLHTYLSEHYYRLVAHDRMSVMCLRFSNVYGPKQRMKGNDVGLWGELLRASLCDEPMVVYNDNSAGRDTLYVGDVMRAFILAAEQEHSKFSAYNVGGVFVPILEFCKAIQSIIPDSKIIKKEMPDELKKIQTGSLILDASAFQKASSWKAECALDQGVFETLQFYKSHKQNYL